MDQTNRIHVLDPADIGLATVALGISGMTRARSVKTIEKAFRGKKGIKRIQIDRDNAVARITFDPRQTHVPELHDMLLQSGYQPSRQRAD